MTTSGIPKQSGCELKKCVHTLGLFDFLLLKQQFQILQLKQYFSTKYMD